MKKELSLGIIGAGISGLSLAASLVRHSCLRVTIFQKEAIVGGRVSTQQVQSGVFADLGANIIDFQNKTQESRVRHFLSTINATNHSKLHLFRQPFMIYQENELRKADYEKQRFYYENGFKQLLVDLQAYVLRFQQRCKVINNNPIKTISRKQGKWYVDDRKQEKTEAFDYLVLSCNGNGIVELLKDYKQYVFSTLRQQIENIKYTRQISLAFQISQANYSSILFKNHPITFISSHIQKYPQQKPIIVMQTGEIFTQKHFKQDQDHIQKQIRQSFPSFLQKEVGKCLKVKKWWPSLIKQKNTNNYKIKGSQNLFIIGDIVTGASRVTNAIESSLLLAQYLQHIFDPKH